MNGLRIGTPELVRRGVTVADAPELASLIALGLTGNDTKAVAAQTRAMRARFQGMHYVRR
jgi:glycine hydroxymethyltransferase